MELSHIQEERVQNLALIPESEWTFEDRAFLEQNPHCKEALEAYQMVFEGLTDQPDPIFAPSFEANIIAQIPDLNGGPQAVQVVEESYVPARTSGREIFFWTGIAAMVIASLGYLFYASRANNTQSSQVMDGFFADLGATFSNVLQGNELLFGAGIACIGGIFLLDKFLNRKNRGYA